MTDTEHSHAPDLPADNYSIALIIDGVVQDVLHCDARLAAIFLSEPQIVEATEWYQQRSDTSKNLVGAVYENGDFEVPPTTQQESAVGSSITPKMNPSFVWNNDTQTWEPPLPYPTDGKNYRWDDATTAWVQISDDIDELIAEMSKDDE
jgi:hypothetical protein